MDGLEQRTMKDRGKAFARRGGQDGAPWTTLERRRKAFNGALYILRTGVPWKDLPPRYDSYQTAHRRFWNWVRSSVLGKILLALAQHLKESGGLDLRECFVDGTFVPAKKRAAGQQHQARNLLLRVKYYFIFSLQAASH